MPSAIDYLCIHVIVGICRHVESWDYHDLCCDAFVVVCITTVGERWKPLALLDMSLDMDELAIHKFMCPLRVEYFICFLVVSTHSPIVMYRVLKSPWFFSHPRVWDSSMWRYLCSRRCCGYLHCCTVYYVLIYHFFLFVADYCIG